jgi:hypothetical protein
MAEFQGMTNEYRKTDEYKAWMKAIQNEYPEMPVYIGEMAIMAHKMDPQFYKKYMKNERKVQKEFEEEMARRQTLTDQISVSVYNNLEEIPSNNINGQTETELPISA